MKLSQTESPEPYAFTHMWDVKLKVTSKQTRQTTTRGHRQEFGGYQREGAWGVLKGEGNQVFHTR